MDNLFSCKKPAKKKKALKITGITMLILFAVISVLSLVFYDMIEAFVLDYGNEGLVGALVSIIPKLTAMIRVLFVTLLAQYVFAIIYGRIFKGSPRRVTIGKLVSGITKFVVWVIGILAVFAVWGVDVGALVASAGVLTVIIGFGLQSLVADVVSGIFLVSDGTLQVGDIVTIDGWRGTVQEIGLRNTRLINYSGDIRVANNSTIKVYINQSREISCPTTKISITYEEDIERVEALFAANREKIKERLPLVTDGPYYWGVADLGDSSINLLFAAYCKEGDFFQVQRDLNRALRIFFAENGIAIPYPQLDVHMPQEERSKAE
ncbi:MAG: mechanosensitive ion channel family protein [Clostridia bacterium]|nr:mechanosensitive ion channel family protein [Clostridia bacterium]